MFQVREAIYQTYGIDKAGFSVWFKNRRLAPKRHLPRASSETPAAYSKPPAGNQNQPELSGMSNKCGAPAEVSNYSATVPLHQSLSRGQVPYPAPLKARSFQHELPRGRQPSSWFTRADPGLDQRLDHINLLNAADAMRTANSSEQAVASACPMNCPPLWSLSSPRSRRGGNDDGYSGLSGQVFEREHPPPVAMGYPVQPQAAQRALLIPAGGTREEGHSGISTATGYQVITQTNDNTLFKLLHMHHQHQHQKQQQQRQQQQQQAQSRTQVDLISNSHLGSDKHKRIVMDGQYVYERPPPGSGFGSGHKYSFEGAPSGSPYQQLQVLQQSVQQPSGLSSAMDPMMGRLQAFQDASGNHSTSAHQGDQVAAAHRTTTWTEDSIMQPSSSIMHHPTGATEALVSKQQPVVCSLQAAAADAVQPISRVPEGDSSCWFGGVLDLGAFGPTSSSPHGGEGRVRFSESNPFFGADGVNFLESLIKDEDWH